MAVSLFSYRRGTSVLHRTAPLVKLALLFILCIVTFSNPVNWWKSAACLAFAALLFVLAGSWWYSLKQLKFVLVLGTLLTAFRMLQLDFTKSPAVTWNKEEMILGIYWMVHFFITTWAAQTIFETTSSLEIQEAFEHVEDSLARVIPSVKKLQGALVLSLAITFIPLVFQTWTKVHLAAQARSPKKKTLTIAVRGLSAEMEAFLSCLINQAETIRKAVSNRS